MDNHFEVIILGTGLAESIAAAALSKAGYKVAHLDTNSFYGGDEAGLSVDELVQWVKDRSQHATDPAYLVAQRSRYSSFSGALDVPPFSRQYTLSLSPAVIHSVGPLISSLIASGVSRYGGYKLLDRIAVYDRPGSIKPVPGSKEEIFRNKELSLMDKRRLMRFMMFAAGEFEKSTELDGKQDIPFLKFLSTTFSLTGRLAELVTYALAMSTTDSDLTLPALQRIRAYFRSSGRYGPSPFLVGHYGGSGEIAQGFCRTSAVNGGVYILGHIIKSISPGPGPQIDIGAEVKRHLTVEIDNFPDQLTCNLLISGPDHLPKTLQGTTIASPAGQARSLARCIAIINGPLLIDEVSGGSSSAEDEGGEENVDSHPQPQGTDSVVLIFPPGSVEGGSADVAVTALVVGAATMSTPKDKWNVYITMQLPASPGNDSAEELLAPFLNAILSRTCELAAPTPTQAIFTLFYIQHCPASNPPSSGAVNPNILITPTSSTLLTDSCDSATANGEALFRQAVQILAPSICREIGVGARVGETTADTPPPFWPPLEGDDEDD